MKHTLGFTETLSVACTSRSLEVLESDKSNREWSNRKRSTSTDNGRLHMRYLKARCKLQQLPVQKHFTAPEVSTLSCEMVFLPLPMLSLFIARARSIQVQVAGDHDVEGGGVRQVYQQERNTRLQEQINGSM